MKKKLRVKAMPGYDTRSDLVRIHRDDRDHREFPRWTVAKLSCNGKSRNVVVLGHDEKPGIIMLDIDHRDALGVDKGDDEEFELTKLGIFGQISYLCAAHDPMLRLPVLISVVSVALGLLSLFLAVASFF